MRRARVLLTGLLVGLGAMQAVAQSATAPIQRPAPQGAVSAMLTVPPGTVVPLSLVSVIRAKSTPLGSTVRAQVAFPVSVGTQLAIPAGVFAEGQLVQVRLPKGSNPQTGGIPTSPLKVHFTKLIFPNGYTAALDAEVSAVEVDTGGTEMAALVMPAELRGHGPSAADAFADPQQQTPTVTDPYEHKGANPAVIYGPILGAAVVTGAILLVHHRAQPKDPVLYDTGYQFAMTLEAPLVLAGSRVAAPQP